MIYPNKLTPIPFILGIGFSLAVMTSILAYLTGFNSGYNRGYRAGTCIGLPWAEQMKCWQKP